MTSRKNQSPLLNYPTSYVKARCAFTLLELLIVVGIIATLLVLMAPAFTYIKGGTDVTSAAYTIKGVLETARTYAKANNTYTWVGFYEEDVSQPSTIPRQTRDARWSADLLCRLSLQRMERTSEQIRIRALPVTETRSMRRKLIQVGKLVKIDNVHLPLFAIGSGHGRHV